MESVPKYQILLTWSEQQQTYIAEAPELLTYQAAGATYEEALAALQGVIYQRIEAAQRVSQEVPLPEKRPLAEARAWLLARAKENGRHEASVNTGPNDLLDETGLQVYAGQQMEALLTTEQVETENTSALYSALCEAYVAGYREAAHKRGWKIHE